MAGKPKKKQKISFQQELKKKQAPAEQSGGITALKPDVLDSKIRIGFVLTAFLLFLPGSIGCLIMGYAGRDKRGSSEVILIGWIAFVIHAFLISLMAIDPSSVGVTPIKILFIVLIALPLILIALSLTGKKFPLAITFRTAGLVLLIPLYAVIAILNPSILWDKVRAQEVITIANAKTIQRAIEKYSGKNLGTYPPDISALSAEELKLPANAFYDSPESVKMRQVNFAAYSSGDVTYIPVTIDGVIRAYYLFAYGSDSTKGKDVNGDGTPDHVIILLSGLIVPENLTGQEYQDFIAKKTTLESLLKK